MSLVEEERISPLEGGQVTEEGQRGMLRMEMPWQLGYCLTSVEPKPIINMNCLPLSF